MSFVRSVRLYREPGGDGFDSFADIPVDEQVLVIAIVRPASKRSAASFIVDHLGRCGWIHGATFDALVWSPAIRSDLNARRPNP